MASTPPLSGSPSRYIFMPLPSVNHCSSERADNLKVQLLADPDSIAYIGNIYVQSASFYKCTSEAQHEFLAFRICDTKSPRRTVLILDRVPHWEVLRPPNPQDQASLDITAEEVQAQRKAVKPPCEPQTRKRLELSRSSYSKPWSEIFEAIFSDGNTPAADMFLISANNNFSQLCEWRGFTEYEELECFSIPHHHLLIENIIVLACAISEHHPSYNLYRHQCYWYAGVIWDVVSTLAKVSPVIKASKQLTKGSAQFARFLTVTPYVNPADRAPVLTEIYHRRWQEFMDKAEPIRYDDLEQQSRAAITQERDQAIAAVVAIAAERDQAVAAIAERDQAVVAIAAERDQAVVAIAAERDRADAADAKVAKLQERLKRKDQGEGTM
ncbi:hypothetical protein FS749_009604 [Ceratobasidium sp. UAMH 11750]|nr:hypothetical protein FS749_009604 [Ceratobasidium sp. UAMH 11750]